jgi:hypothetical protein
MQRPVASGVSLLSLPAEILFDILGYLVKSDIKSVRLVNKECNRQSSPLLFEFDRIDFSPQYKNLEVFRAISQSSVHRNTVKELVYDATWFNTEMDKATYDYVLRESYNSDWLKQPHRTELDRGYDMYRKHVEDQISLIEEELVHLCEGLPLLPNLEQVCIRDWWTWEYGPSLRSHLPGFLVEVHCPYCMRCRIHRIHCKIHRNQCILYPTAKTKC